MAIFDTSFIRSFVLGTLFILIAASIRFFLFSDPNEEKHSPIVDEPTPVSSEKENDPVIDLFSSDSSEEIRLPDIIQNDEPEIWPTGYVVIGSRVIVSMSDGTSRWSNRRNKAISDSIDLITPSFVKLDGETLYFKKALIEDEDAPRQTPELEFIDPFDDSVDSIPFFPRSSSDTELAFIQPETIATPQTE